MIYYGWKVGVVAIVFRLSGSIRVHLKKRLRIYLSSIIIIPSRVYDCAIVQDRGVNGVYLIKPNPSETLAVFIAFIHVADFCPPAVNGLHAT